MSTAAAKESYSSHEGSMSLTNDLLDSLESNMEERLHKMESKFALLVELVSNMTESIEKVEDLVVKVLEGTSLNRFSIEKSNSKLEKFLKHLQSDPDDAMGNNLIGINSGLSAISLGVKECQTKAAISLLDIAELNQNVNASLTDLSLGIDKSQSVNQTNHAHLMDHISNLGNNILLASTLTTHSATANPRLSIASCNNPPNLILDNTTSSLSSACNPPVRGLPLFNEISDVLSGGLPDPVVEGTNINSCSKDPSALVPLPSNNFDVSIAGSSKLTDKRKQKHNRNRASKRRKNVNLTKSCPGTDNPQSRSPVLTSSNLVPCSPVLEGLNPQVPLNATSRNNRMLSAGKNDCTVFISRLSKETTEADVSQFIMGALSTSLPSFSPESFKCRKISKEGNRVSSFKITPSSKELFDTLLLPSFWPARTLVKEFTPRLAVLPRIRQPMCISNPAGGNPFERSNVNINVCQSLPIATVSNCETPSTPPKN